MWAVRRRGTIAAMRERPDGLDDSDVAAGLAAGWGIPARDIRYLPVGFGGYHWAAGDLFLTVDDGPVASLRRALGVAAGLDLDFVVAPLPTVGGDPVWSLSSRYTLSVFPLLDGTAGSFGPHRPEDRAEVLDLLGRLHRADPGDAEPEDPALPGRDDLLTGLDEPWTAGPYAEPCRRLLADRSAAIAAELSEFDMLTARIAGLPRVVTHGEPHPGNFIRTPKGLRLIDWDTVRLAPAERDLWLVDGPGEPDALAYYRLRWRLADIASFAGQFRLPHRANDDTTAAWGYLGSYFR
jgi:spectinomycin phosphotransferase